MHDDAAVPFAQGTVRILTLSGVRNLEAWKRAFQDKCKDHRYFELIEETLANDFEYRYAVLADTSGNIRGIQPILFVRQNLVEGMRGPFRKIVDLIREKFPRFLTMRVLMVGCAAGAGELGVCNPEDDPAKHPWGKPHKTHTRPILPTTRNATSSAVALSH